MCACLQLGVIKPFMKFFHPIVSCSMNAFIKLVLFVVGGLVVVFDLHSCNEELISVIISGLQFSFFIHISRFDIFEFHRLDTSGAWHLITCSTFSLSSPHLGQFE